MARYVHNNLEMFVFIEQTRIHLYIQYVCTHRNRILYH